MISVKSIRSHNGGEGVKITVAFDSGEKNEFTVSATDFIKLGTVKGEIGEEDLYALFDADKRYAASSAALRILSFGQCSKKKLYEKLRLRGFTHECAKNAAEEAAAKGYIDEAWQVESYLGELVEKRHMGKRKAVPMLLSKGYSSAQIYSVLDKKYGSEAFDAAKRAFLEKKFGKTEPENREEAEAMKKALYKQGF